MSETRSDTPTVDKKSVTITTSDGVGLAATVYSRAIEKNNRVVIIASGVGLLQERYSEYAKYMAGQGWTAITFDYRGVGKTALKPDLRADSRLRDWGEFDLAACIDWADSQLDAPRIVLVAHSVGGQIFAFAQNHSKVESIVAVCAQKGYWKYWDGKRKIGLLSLWCLLPVLVSLFGYLPLRLMGKGADIPAGVAREWGRWGRNEEFVDEHGDSLNAEFAKITSNMLAISFSDDKFYAPLRAVEALNSVYTNTEQSHWHFAPKELDSEWLGHFGFFRGKKQIHALWGRVDSWLETNAKIK